MKRNIIIILLSTKLILSQYTQITNKTKCSSSSQKMILKMKGRTTVNFSISMWIRLENYKNILTKENFMAFKSNDFKFEIDIIKSDGFFSLFYENNILGDLKYFNDTNGQDFSLERQLFENWHFFVFSYKEEFEVNNFKIFFDDSVKIDLDLNNQLDLEKTIFFYCLSFDNSSLEDIYFADILFYNSFFVLTNDFLKLKNYPNDVIGLFFFANESKKERYFIANSISFEKDKIGPMEVLTNSLDYPFLKTRNFYSISIFKKYFKFKISDNSLIDNSYIISIKMKINTNFDDINFFDLYLRTSKNLNPFDENFAADKISFRFGVIPSNLINTYLKYFDNEVEKGLDLKSHYENGIKIIFIFHLKHRIINKKNTREISFYNCEINKLCTKKTSEYENLNLSNEDKHYFGNNGKFTTYIQFFILEYIIIKGDQIKDSISKIEINENIIISKDFFKQERFNIDNLAEPIYNSENFLNQNYCGFLNCLKGSVFDGCSTCQNKIDKGFLCFEIDGVCSDQFDYFTQTCYSDYNRYDMILNYVDGKIVLDSASVDQLKTFIPNFHVLSFIFVLVTTFEEQEISYDINFMQMFDENFKFENLEFYFNGLSSAYDARWIIYYKTINLNDYENLNIYGKCLNNLTFMPINNYKGICKNTCDINYFINEKNNCVKCMENCQTCDLDTCLICSDGYKLVDKNCIEYSDCHTTDLNCDICGSKMEVCLKCKNYFVFSKVKELCILECYYKDDKCVKCRDDEPDKCEICKENFEIYNGKCSTNC